MGVHDHAAVGMRGQKPKSLSGLSWRILANIRNAQVAEVVRGFWSRRRFQRYIL